eukprot:Rmarinus@m.27899
MTLLTVTVEDVLAKGLGFEFDDSLVITSVKNGAAADAGLREGDQLEFVGSQSVRGLNKNDVFTALVAGGDHFEVAVRREAIPHDVDGPAELSGDDNDDDDDDDAELVNVGSIDISSMGRRVVDVHRGSGTLGFSFMQAVNLGLAITDVAPESAAERAGIRPGDIVVGIADEENVEGGLESAYFIECLKSLGEVVRLHLLEKTLQLAGEEGEASSAESASGSEPLQNGFASGAANGHMEHAAGTGSQSNDDDESLQNSSRVDRSDSENPASASVPDAPPADESPDVSVSKVEARPSGSAPDEARASGVLLDDNVDEHDSEETTAPSSPTAAGAISSNSEPPKQTDQKETDVVSPNATEETMLRVYAKDQSFGCSFVVFANRVVVTRVKQNSSAAIVGVIPGMFIRNISGNPVPLRTDDVMSEIAAVRDNPEAYLSLSAEMDPECAPYNLTVTVPDSSDSVGFSFVNLGEMGILYITRVDEPSAASEAGIRVGDELLSWGGSELAGLSTDEVIKLFKETTRPTEAVLQRTRIPTSDPSPSGDAPVDVPSTPRGNADSPRDNVDSPRGTPRSPRGKSPRSSLSKRFSLSPRRSSVSSKSLANLEAVRQMVVVRAPNTSFGFAFALGVGTGVVVSQVTPKSPADVAGLAPGWFIREVDGVAVGNLTRGEIFMLISRCETDLRLLVQPPKPPPTPQSPRRKESASSARALSFSGTSANHVPENEKTETDTAPQPGDDLEEINIQFSQMESLGIHMSVETTVQGTVILVASVETDSPAEKAGLRKDHEIVKVNGKPIAELPYETAVQEITSADRKIQLHVRYRLEATELSPVVDDIMTLIEELENDEIGKTALLYGVGERVVELLAHVPSSSDASHVPSSEGCLPLGLTFAVPSRTLNLPVLVARVTDGSPAAAAGISRGDRIVAINGQSVLGMDLNAIHRVISEGAKKPYSLRVVSRRGPDSPPEGVEIVEAHLSRDPTESLGLSFMGLPSNDGVSIVVCVDSVREESPAARAGVQAGDCAVRVNGELTTSLSQEEMVQCVKAAGNNVTLELWRGVERPDARDDDGGIDITLHGIESSADFSFISGSGVNGKVVVYSVVPDGIAEKAGLQVNDIILSINGTRVRGFSAAEILRLVKSCHPELRLRVCRPEAATHVASNVRTVVDDSSELGDDESVLIVQKHTIRLGLVTEPNASLGIMFTLASHLRIRSVAEGGAAARALLQPLDEILQVGKSSVVGMDLEDVAKLVKGFGRNIPLRVRRVESDCRETVKNVTVALAEADAGLGLSLRMSVAVVIRSVRKGSVAALGGVLPGDELLSIGSRVLSEETPEGISQCLRNVGPRPELTILRKKRCSREEFEEHTRSLETSTLLGSESQPLDATLSSHNTSYGSGDEAANDLTVSSVNEAPAKVFTPSIASSDDDRRQDVQPLVTISPKPSPRMHAYGFLSEDTAAPDRLADGSQRLSQRRLLMQRASSSSPQLRVLSTHKTLVSLEDDGMSDTSSQSHVEAAVVSSSGPISQGYDEEATLKHLEKVAAALGSDSPTPRMKYLDAMNSPVPTKTPPSTPSGSFRLKSSRSGSMTSLSRRMNDTSPYKNLSARASPIRPLGQNGSSPTLRRDLSGSFNVGPAAVLNSPNSLGSLSNRGTSSPSLRRFLSQTPESKRSQRRLRVSGVRTIVVDDCSGGLGCAFGRKPNGRIMVSRIRSGGLGEDIGLSVGDEILEVGGNIVTTTKEVVEFLKEAGSESVVLKVLSIETEPATH